HFRFSYWVAGSKVAQLTRAQCAQVRATNFFQIVENSMHSAGNTRWYRRRSPMITRHLPATFAVIASALLYAEAYAAEAQLGSADYKASVEHPMGWRGDYSGHYPGATPPMTWYRKLKSPLQELLSQARKPADGDEKSADVIGIVGRPTQWLALG